MNKKIILLFACLLGTSSVYAEQKTMSLEERVAELEANQAINIFTFGGTLGVRYDGVTYKQSTPAGAGAFEASTEHWRLTSGLNANANVSNKIKFYSTLAASKNFNSWQTQSSGVGTAPSYLTDATDSRAERGSQVYLEKAYADYAFANNMTFSFGRLPTMDGPPSEMSLGTARMGTYPSVGYNAPFDGLALSYNLPMEKQNLAVRLLYTPMTYLTTGTGKLASASEGLGNVTISGSKTNSEVPFGAVMVEYGIDGTAVANKLNFLVFAYQTGNLSLDGSLFNAGGGAGTGLVDFKVGGQVFTASFTKVADTGLDLSLTYFQSKVENSGSLTVPGLGAIYGFGASAQGDTLTGSTKLYSARYKINNTFIGVEYLDGGKNVFNYDPATEVVNGFYSTTGTGTHVYVTQKLTPELGLRVGYMKQEYKTTPFTFGASVDTDRTIDTVYSSLRLDF